MSLLEELIGKTLDEKYKIEKKLGQGGMGAVYRATHIGTKRPVAVKVISPQYMANTEFIERFKREAEAAGLLRHPNVVNVTDFGFANVDSQRVAYLVMEYLNGCSLGDMFKKKGRLPLGFIVDVVEQICLAIENAHNQGIIHRDLKPDNIWLEPNGRGGYTIKVLDFGLAKLKHSVGVKKQRELTKPLVMNQSDDLMEPITATAITAKVTGSDTEIHQTQITSTSEVTTAANNPHITDANESEMTNAAGLTQAGAVLGTPIYMSPEQCLGEKLDARSDIYSLGIIIYQILAGEAPFKGISQFLMVQHIQTPPPPIKDKCPEIPKPVADLVMSTLAKSPEERPKTAAAFATALRASAEGETPIINQAFELYRRHFPACFQIAWRVYIAFIMINFALLIGLSQLPLQNKSEFLIHLIHKSHWFIALVLVLFANSLNTAAFTMVIEQLYLSPASPVQIKPIMTKLNQNFVPLLFTCIKGYWRTFVGLLNRVKPGFKTFIDLSLCAPVVMIEGKQGDEALSRASELADRLRALTIRLQLRDFCIASLAMLGFVCIFVIYGFILDTLEPDPASHGPLLTLFGILPAAWLILTHPPVAMSHAIIYIKTRQIGNEKIQETLDRNFEEIDLPVRSQISYKRTTIIVSVVLFLLSTWFFINGTMLRHAVDHNYYNCVKALIIAGADMNDEDSTGKTALMHAAEDGHTETVRALIKAGARVNAVTEKNWTALMFAADFGHTEAVRELIRQGSDVNARHVYGSTPLTRAARHGYNDTVKALIEGGADVNSQNNFGLTPIMEAIGDEGNIDTVKILVAAGSNINLRNKNGVTALTLAKRKEVKEMTEYLVGAGATE